MKNQLLTMIQRIALTGLLCIFAGCESEETFQKPIIDTTEISYLTESSVETGGFIHSDEGNIVLKRGVCWSTNPNPTIMDSITDNAAGTGGFVSKISGLISSTTYFLRAYATNKGGTSYGLQITFTTKSLALTTKPALYITSSSAMIGGIVASDGDSINITARGICWSTFSNPTIDDSITINGLGKGSYNSILTGLVPNTTYYARAYVTNSVGTRYGNEISFTTIESDPTKVIDIDGNEYPVIKIGSQIWMASNLKTKTYRNGEPVSNVKDYAAWQILSTGAWCDYDNDSINGNTFGHLYNWFAVNDSRNIAPLGWHIPSDSEWDVLVAHLGGASIAGGKLKDSSYDFWLSPNVSATNESGFNALPSGFSNSRGWNMYTYCYWWSSTEYNATQAWYRFLHNDEAIVGRTYNHTKNLGFSIRCIKD